MAYETILAAQVEDSYSAVARLGREKVLYAAREGVRSVKGRAPLLLPEFNIEAMLLPGTLALLEQVGQHDLAVQLGTAALQRGASRDLKSSGVSRDTMKDFEKDIALATALAHCGLARDAADRGQGALACARMEEAVSILREYNTAPTLASEVENAIEEMRPVAILDALKAPLDLADVSRRQSIVSALKKMLQKGNSAVPITQEYVSNALPLLSAEEICNVADWEKLALGKNAPVWLEPAMLAQAGLAHLVAGFLTHQPELVATAKRILITTKNESDITVPLAVSEVLLGSTQAALSLLQADERLADVNPHDKAAAVAAALRPKTESEMPPRDGIMEFIRAASQTNGHDLLPGLCLFVERWLMVVAFPKIRDTSELNYVVSLATYFDDARVADALSRENLRADLTEIVLGQKDAIMKGLAGVAVLGAAAVVYNLLGFAAPRKPQLHLVPPPPAAATIDMTPLKLSLKEDVVVVGHQQSTKDGDVVLSKEAAAQLIRNWLAVKAEAMGPRHRTSRLGDVLAEPMLSAVRVEAQEAARSGWFWTIRPLAARVDSIDCASLTRDAKGYVTITATIDESADLWASNGKKGDSYKTRYKVEYRMVKADSGWKLSSALVLGK